MLRLSIRMNLETSLKSLASFISPMGKRQHQMWYYTSIKRRAIGVYEPGPDQTGGVRRHGKIRGLGKKQSKRGV